MVKEIPSEEQIFEAIREYAEELGEDIDTVLIRPSSYKGAFIYYDRLRKGGIVIGYHNMTEERHSAGPVLRLEERARKSRKYLILDLVRDNESGIEQFTFIRKPSFRRVA